MKVENPVKLTDEVSLKLEQAAAIDATWEECAFYAGISPACLYNWLESVEGLRERLEALRNKPVLKARQSLVGSLDSPEMALKYLERKRKVEFALRLESTGADGEALFADVTETLKSLTEQLRADEDAEDADAKHEQAKTDAEPRPETAAPAAVRP
ncbi:MAG: hypothetical protein M0R37_12095 [Bacteroidales bacterium]|jgi:hypothetical protein|nr:hypothetical protein [Sphaerochaeta sp.]MCK9629316.1 hypothetical protein [Bacteroidales bacterium]